MKTKESNTKTLRLALKCVIMNDFEHVHQMDDLVCIVAHPNLSKYINVIDPILSNMPIAEYFEEIRKCENSSSTSKSKYSSSRHYASPSTSAMTAATPEEVDDEEENVENNDFHFYQFHHISLKKKEKLLLPVFNVEIPYKDFYRCIIDRTKRSYGSYYSTDDSDDSTLTTEV